MKRSNRWTRSALSVALVTLACSGCGVIDQVAREDTSCQILSEEAAEAAAGQSLTPTTGF